MSPGHSSHPQLSTDATSSDQPGRLEVLQGPGMASGSSTFPEQTEKQHSLCCPKQEPT